MIIYLFISLPPFFNAGNDAGKEPKMNLQVHNPISELQPLASYGFNLCTSYMNSFELLPIGLRDTQLETR